MNKQKALKTAIKWLNTKPPLQELKPEEVFSVLEALDFTLKRKIKHTTFFYMHNCLRNSDYFKFGVLKISIHHKKSAPDSVLIGSVKNIIKALNLHPELKNV